MKGLIIIPRHTAFIHRDIFGIEELLKDFNWYSDLIKPVNSEYLAGCFGENGLGRLRRSQ